MGRRSASHTLSAARREAMQAELRRLVLALSEAREAEDPASAAQAEADLKMHVLHCWEAGLTDTAASATLLVSRQTVIKWKADAKQARDQIRSGRTRRPAQSGQDG